MGVVTDKHLSIFSRRNRISWLSYTVALNQNQCVSNSQVHFWTLLAPVYTPWPYTDSKVSRGTAHLSESLPFQIISLPRSKVKKICLFLGRRKDNKIRGRSKGCVAIADRFFASPPNAILFLQAFPSWTTRTTPGRRTRVTALWFWRREIRPRRWPSPVSGSSAEIVTACFPSRVNCSTFAKRRTSRCVAEFYFCERRAGW